MRLKSRHGSLRLVARRRGRFPRRRRPGGSGVGAGRRPAESPQARLQSPARGGR